MKSISDRSTETEILHLLQVQSEALWGTDRTREIEICLEVREPAYPAYCFRCPSDPATRTARQLCRQRRRTLEPDTMGTLGFALATTAVREMQAGDTPCAR